MVHTAFSLLFKKTAPALPDGVSDALCDGRQNPGELKLNPDARIFDVDESARRLFPHSPFDGDEPAEWSDNLIDARFQTTPRLGLAEPMRNGYDNRVRHSCPLSSGFRSENYVGRRGLSRKATCPAPEATGSPLS